MTEEYLLEMKDVYKSFQNNHVLKGIHLGVKKGEVHVLLGENGAGKSTLIKLLTGAYPMNKGKIYWESKQVEIKSPIEAMELGIATIYQELNIIPDLMVYENIFLGREIRKNSKLLDKKEMIKKSKEILIRLGQDSKLATKKISTLGMGIQQLVEIAKALSLNAKILIMDEPTSSLSNREVEQLYSIVRQLKSEGIAIVFITHKLEEIREIGDRITILRDGQEIKTIAVKDTTTDYWIELMVGRTLEEKYPKKTFTLGEIGFSIQNFKVEKNSQELNLDFREGEIVGISGLVGAGRTELARAIFGADKRYSGHIFINNVEKKITSPREAIDSGIAFITEDRKSEGLLLDLSMPANISIASLKDFRGKGNLINLSTMEKHALEFATELQIYPENKELSARFFSGGNQQKIVIAKWLCTKAKVFIFDEPTRGIDIGAKVEVYRLMNHLVDEGAIVIMISSDLPEVLGMCDRVLVMKEGRVTANTLVSETTQEKIMAASTQESIAKEELV